MVKFIYNSHLIDGDEKVFYIYLGVICLIILITIILVILSVRRKNVNK